MSKHIFLVPRAWDSFQSSQLEVILKKKISCNQVTEEIGGVEIKINGVKTNLHYWDGQPWMKKDNDRKTWPDPAQYFGVYRSCDDCWNRNKPTTDSSKTI